MAARSIAAEVNLWFEGAARGPSELIVLFSSWPAAAQSDGPAITGALSSGTTVVVAGRNGVVTLVVGDETASNLVVNQILPSRD